MIGNNISSFCTSIENFEDARCVNTQCIDRVATLSSRFRIVSVRHEKYAFFMTLCDAMMTSVVFFIKLHWWSMMLRTLCATLTAHDVDKRHPGYASCHQAAVTFATTGQETWRSSQFCLINTKYIYSIMIIGERNISKRI